MYLPWEALRFTETLMIHFYVLKHRESNAKCYNFVEVDTHHISDFRPCPVSRMTSGAIQWGVPFMERRMLLLLMLRFWNRITRHWSQVFTKSSTCFTAYSFSVLDMLDALSLACDRDKNSSTRDIEAYRKQPVLQKSHHPPQLKAA